jgi:hypothetical protein
MAREEFQQRLDRIGSRPVTPPSGAAASVRAAQSGGALHMVGGGIWGVALGFLMVYLNQSYETLVRGPSGPEPWALVAIGFLLLSVLVLGVMLLSGLLYALAGRLGRRRWMVLFGAFIGLGFGAYLARAALSASA